MAAPINTSGKLQADTTTGASVTLTAPFTFTAGRDVIVSMVAFASTGVRISAVTVGGTAATLDVRNTFDTLSSSEIWRAQNIAGGTANIVVTVPAGAFVTLSAEEWAAGVLTASALDAGTTNNAQGTSAAPTVATAATTSQASTVVYSTVVALNSTAANGISTPGGWTQTFVEQNASAHEAGAGAWQEQTTVGVKTAIFTITSTSWAASIAAYKLSASGVGGLAWFRA